MYLNKINYLKYFSICVDIYFVKERLISKKTNIITDEYFNICIIIE